MTWAWWLLWQCKCITAVGVLKLMYVQFGFAFLACPNAAVLVLALVPSGPLEQVRVGRPTFATDEARGVLRGLDFVCSTKQLESVSSAVGGRV